MSHPIIVDTVENSFVPLLTVNNSVTDAVQLKRFDEPAWNYQVVRFLNSDGKDIIPRKDKVWTLPALTERMVLSLEKAQQPIPPLLKLLQQEADTRRHATAAFSMYCYWTGEVQLGAIDGVITTEAGYFDGHEVTLVTYDKTQLTLQQLVQQAEQIQCFERLYVPASDLLRAANTTKRPVGKLTKNYKKAKRSDQKRQLAGTAFAKLGLRSAGDAHTTALSPAQATKVNAFARTNRAKALRFLTKRQREAL